MSLRHSEVRSLNSISASSRSRASVSFHYYFTAKRLISKRKMSISLFRYNEHEFLNFIKFLNYKCFVLFKITDTRLYLNLVAFFRVLSFIFLGSLSASSRRSVQMLQIVVVGLLLSVLPLPYHRCFFH